ncbi:MAG: DNA cytosine methyltransferase [Bacteroidales bacterium]|nr:DNA cytosine methyltransferase [Bacteroidales bacterium]
MTVEHEIDERNGGKNIVDLFAGRGGMSLGFELSGLKPILAIEKDEWASETYATILMVIILF